MLNNVPPEESRLSKFTPNCLTIDRFISAMRTFSITCSGVATLRRLTGMMLSIASGLLMSMPGLSAALTSISACAASSGEATVPFSTAIWPTVVTVTFASGIAS